MHLFRFLNNKKKRLYLSSNYFSLLLCSLICLFIFRPYDRGHLYISIWQLFFVSVFLAAIFNCNHTRQIQIISSAIALPALVLQWINLFIPHSLMMGISLALTILFITITTSSIIRQVVINARVKTETLRGVICAYFMIAFNFAFIYFLIAIFSPGAFNLNEEISPLFAHSHYLSEMIYFSFVTLLGIGYGDITPARDITQTFTILEGVVGQFYVAILVARLVAVYSFYEYKLQLPTQK